MQWRNVNKSLELAVISVISTLGLLYLQGSKSTGKTVPSGRLPGGEKRLCSLAVTSVPKPNGNRGRALRKDRRARGHGWAGYQCSRNTVIMVLGKFSS